MNTRGSPSQEMNMSSPEATPSPASTNSDPVFFGQLSGESLGDSEDGFLDASEIFYDFDDPLLLEFDEDTAPPSNEQLNGVLYGVPANIEPQLRRLASPDVQEAFQVVEVTTPSETVNSNVVVQSVMDGGREVVTVPSRHNSIAAVELSVTGSSGASSSTALHSPPNRVLHPEWFMIDTDAADFSIRESMGTPENNVREATEVATRVTTSSVGTTRRSRISAHGNREHQEPEPYGLAIPGIPTFRTTLNNFDRPLSSSAPSTFPSERARFSSLDDIAPDGHVPARLKVDMEAVLGELRCPVCLDLYRHPIILPCSHVLCRQPCAERIFHQGFVRCPVCRDHSYVAGGIDTLPRVISLENIIDQYEEGLRKSENVLEECAGEGDVPCQLCEEQPVRKATKSCVDCNASYCQACLQLSHPTRAPFCDHQLVEPIRNPRPKESQCTIHAMRVNIYCNNCKVLGCVLCADDPTAHPNHQVMSLTEAKQLLTSELLACEESAQQSQDAASNATQTCQDSLASFQRNVEEARSTLNGQFAAVQDELERKRGFFLSDLEYEERSKSEAMMRDVCARRQLCTNWASVGQCAREVLKETEPCAFISLANSVMDRFKQVTQQSSGTADPPVPTTHTLANKQVDLRREKALIRDMAYLQVPATPEISVDGVFRSEGCLALTLRPPPPDSDVIDGYILYYSTKGRRALEEQIYPKRYDRVLLRGPAEERRAGRVTVTAEAAVCLVQHGLQADTLYSVAVRAYNAAGESEMSPIVNARTLREPPPTIQAPVIEEANCRTFTHAIQVFSTAPLDVATEDGLSHVLLYREASADKVWRCIPLYCRQDHRVFGLESDTTYEFCVLAHSQTRECRLSDVTTLTSEAAAY